MPFGCASCFRRPAADDGPPDVAPQPCAPSSNTVAVCHETKQAPIHVHAPAAPLVHNSPPAEQAHVPHTPEPSPSGGARRSRDTSPVPDPATPTTPRCASPIHVDDEDVDIWALVDPSSVSHKSPNTILTANAAKVIAAQHDARQAQGMMMLSCLCMTTHPLHTPCTPLALCMFAHVFNIPTTTTCLQNTHIPTLCSTYPPVFVSPTTPPPTQKSYLSSLSFVPLYVQSAPPSPMAACLSHQHSHAQHNHPAQQHNHLAPPVPRPPLHPCKRPLSLGNT